MSQGYILIILMADGCGGCKRFKSKHYDSLISQVRKLSNVKLLEIQVPSISYQLKQLESKYHPDLKNWCFWYPCFALFTIDSWNNKSGRLKGSVYALQSNSEGRAAFDKLGNPQMDRTKRIITPSIMGWIGQQTRPAPRAVTPVTANKLKYASYTPDLDFPRDYNP